MTGDRGSVAARVAVGAGLVLLAAIAIAGLTSPETAGIRDGAKMMVSSVAGIAQKHLPGFDGSPTRYTGNLAASVAWGAALSLVILAIAKPARESTRGFVLTILTGAAVALFLFSPTLVGQVTA